MPLNLQQNLPAIELLKKEHIFVMDSLRAEKQDIRPLRVVVLNLMPLKITTETDLVRLLSNTPLQVELDFMKIKGHFGVWLAHLFGEQVHRITNHGFRVFQCE